MFIIARDEISMSEITVTNKECPLVLASIMLCNQTRVKLGAFYRQPNHTVTEINELLTNITSCTTNGQSELIIGGDFNLPGILWNDGAVINDVPSYGLEVNNRFLEVCDTLGVTQIVTEPTRESNILDLLLVTSPNIYSDVEIVPGISDHDAVCVTYLERVNRNRKKQDIYTFIRKRTCNP